MESPVLVVVVVLAVIVACGYASVRMVPAGSVGVVLRAGRVTRRRRPGPVVVVPGLERIEMVSLRPAPIEPLGVTALTRDAVEVDLAISVLWRVTDPVLAITAEPCARAVTAAAVERGVRHLVATVDLADLLRDRADLLAPLPTVTWPLVEPFGVDVVDVDLLDTEVRVGPELLHLLA
ncbi:SPFH domain-containing protein [Aeromicrobium terrae]|nr:SPFH domain-containing protein [Aeromicrobium terrae]